MGLLNIAGVTVREMPPITISIHEITVIEAGLFFMESRPKGRVTRRFGHPGAKAIQNLPGLEVEEMR
jgi:hypothetical protein